MAEQNQQTLKPSTDVYDDDAKDEEPSACVFDNGSAYMKVGYAGEDEATSIFPAVIGKPRVRSKIYQATAMCHSSSKDQRVLADEAIARQGDLSVTHPMQSGYVENWDDMERLWQYAIYDQLKIEPQNYNLYVTEPALNPKANREKTTQIFFELFGCAGYYVSIAAVCSLYASGRTTGMVLDAGHDSTRCVPVYEGYCLPHAVQLLNVGGKHMEDYFEQMLRSERNYEHSIQQKQALLEQQQKLCYVALDYDVDYEKYVASISPDGSLQHQFELPDGTVITVGSERFRCPEILFQPSSIIGEEDGVHRKLARSVAKCDVDIREDLYRNIILCGGNSMYDGMSKRIEKELKKETVQFSDKARVIAPPERSCAAWIGGSIAASLSTFEDMWILKEEYDCAGPSIVHRKCY